MTVDGPHRRVRRAPGARLVAALALLVAVLALPPASAAFSARTGTPANSLAADLLQPPGGLTATQTCTYAPVVLQERLASTKANPLELSPPPGTQAGDVLVAQVAYYGTSTVPAPTGWSRISLPDTSGGVVTSAVYWKVAVDDEPVATFTRPDTTTGDMVGGIVGYRGVSRSAPVASGRTGAGETATSPAASTTVTGTVVVHLLTRSGTVGLPPPTGTSPLWTRSSDSESVTASYESSAGPGAVPERTSTTSGSTTAWIAQTVVLRPALQQVGASLSWTATPSSWADGYQGQRWANGTVQRSSTVPMGTTTVTDTGLVNGTTYTYRVWTVRGSWTSVVQTTTLNPSC